MHFSNQPKSAGHHSNSHWVTSTAARRAQAGGKTPSASPFLPLQMWLQHGSAARTAYTSTSVRWKVKLLCGSAVLVRSSKLIGCWATKLRTVCPKCTFSGNQAIKISSSKDKREGQVQWNSRFFMILTYFRVMELNMRCCFNVTHNTKDFSPRKE